MTPMEEVGVSSVLLPPRSPETSTLSGALTAPGVSTAVLPARSGETPETSATAEQSFRVTAGDRVRSVSLLMLPARSTDTLELVVGEGADGMEMRGGVRAAD